MRSYPLTYLQWLDKCKYGLTGPIILESQTLMNNTDWLIDRLYEPHKEIGIIFSTKWARAEGLRGIRKEAINWGDLKCVEAHRHSDGGWDIVIDEADPNCPILQGYIKKWLVGWGWAINEVR